ncbi:ADP-ribosyltransferase [Pedobacter helvus]|uniref:ADP-ribosyltransferase n=1 Tax=Pedobacter helvus TaxID=2563444 RepID=A0ABW9JNX5_9SPHI|nr:ADP-ribosyltransferase [Pedobacter ureilyticus]
MEIGKILLCRKNNMTPMNTKPKMHEDDQFFLRNYAELKPDYLKNVAHHANLDDVKNGLVNLADADCITNYSGNMSRVVHPNLKNKTIDQTVLVKDFEQRLHLALECLPSFGQQTVYRMETHHPVISDYQNYFKGKFGQVMSVSFNLSTSKDDWEDEKVVYVINTLTENSRAKDISRLTNFAKEQEVLFLKDTHFQINRQEEKNGKLYIYMQETLSPATFAYNYVEISYNCNASCSDEEPGMFD